MYPKLQPAFELWEDKRELHICTSNSYYFIIIYLLLSEREGMMATLRVFMAGLRGFPLSATFILLFKAFPLIQNPLKIAIQASLSCDQAQLNLRCGDPVTSTQSAGQDLSDSK
jgi:hypothetical protein